MEENSLYSPRWRVTFLNAPDRLMSTVRNRGDAKHPDASMEDVACQHRVIGFEKDEDGILPG